MSNFIVLKESWKNKYHDLEEWVNSFTPTSKYEGKSALTLAKYCLHQDKIKNLLTTIVARSLPNLKFTLERAEPEHGSSIGDKFPRKRMQDLGVWGKVEGTGKNIFIGVEAKVVETFGQSISSAYKNSSNTAERIDGLLKNYYKGKIDKNSKLPYQLLYSLVGTIREESIDSIHIFTVIVFKTKHLCDHLNKADNNRNAFEKFMKGVGAKCTHSFDSEYETYELDLSNNLGGNSKLYLSYNVVEPL